MRVVLLTEPRRSKEQKMRADLDSLRTRNSGRVSFAPINDAVATTKSAAMASTA